jgi:DnaJ-class molecular chaperone
MMQIEQDYYKVLGVAPEASMAEIKAAYHKLAFQYHPDRNQNNPESYVKMLEINAAYSVLSDSLQRSKYDNSRGYRTAAPKFKAGSKVRITSRTSPYVDHTGVVYQEPAKDSRRFWYMVKFESNGLPAVDRFAEEQLMEVV